MTSVRHDARLVGPALGVWVGAAGGCAIRGGVGAGWLALGVLALLLSLGCRRLLVAAVVGGAVLGGASAAVHVSLARTGPVAVAAARHAHATVELTVVRDPQARVGAHGSPFVLADATVTSIDGRTAHAAVLVIAHGGSWIGLLPGQRLRVPGRLQPPRAGDGLSAVVLTTGPAQLVGRPPWWQRLAGDVRARLRDACAGLPADERALVPGLVVGDVSQMPPSLTAAFRASGLTHLNAVSGENCAIVLATVGALVRRTPLRRGWRHLVAGLSLLAFVVLARPSPSVLRAAVMGGAALAAGALGRRGQPLPLLSAAVIGLVLADPFLALAPGFALSVLATAAIVLAAPALTGRLARRLPHWLAVAVAVPAAAQLACTPVLVAAFGQLSPWAVPANLLAAPAVAPATVLGVATALVAVVSPMLAAVVAVPAAVPAGWLALVARGIAALPGSRAGLSPAAGAVLAAAAAAVAVVVTAAALRSRGVRLHEMLGEWPP